MFSNFVAAISTSAQSENGSSTSPRSSMDVASNPDSSPRRSVALSATSHLAESALSSLRKSIVSQRTSSNIHSPPMQSPSRELEPVMYSTGRRKLSLENRLRASLAKEAAEEKPVESPLPPLREEADPTRIPLPLSPPPAPAEPVPAPLTGLEQPLTLVRAEGTVGTEAEEEPVPKAVEDLPRARLSDPITPSKPTFSEERALHHPPTPPTPPARSPPATPATPSNWHKEQRHAHHSFISSPFEPVHPEQDPLESSTRLHAVQSRSDDIPTVFERLQAERNDADTVLREFTPLEGMSDAQGLRDHFHNMNLKLDMSAEEIKRLNARIQQHDERVEEIRDTHRLESKSQTELIDSLRTQLAQAQTQITSLSDSQSSASAVFEALTGNLEKTKVKAKEEEEKCAKAITLLKTVRTKLVKAEKDRDEALAQVKEKETLVAEVARFKSEVDRVRAEGVKEVQRVQTAMSANAAAEREQLEKEWLARKGQWEIEAITAKAQYSKELATKSREVERLEENVRVLGREKDGLFEEVQLKSGEGESARVQLDVLHSQVEEMRFRLRESEERMSALQEEVAEARRGHATNDLDAPTTSPGAGELAALLSETTSRHEVRLAELRNRMRTLELERADAEESWSRTLQQRAEESERLRGIIAIKDREFKDALDGRRARDEIVQRLEADVERERKEKEVDRRQISELAREVEDLRESLLSKTFEVSELTSRLGNAESSIESLKAKETQLKTSNKALREELRKVQSSAALLERQRNPGVGYWSATSPRTASSANGASSSSPNLPLRHEDSPRNSLSSVDGVAPAVTSPKEQRAEEEVNLEYLRNVILQFLEHPQMRADLVRVLSIILRFTPQETRRLIARV